MDFKVNLPLMNIQVLSISAHFNQVEGAWSYPKHHHDTFEFLYMLDGGAELRVRDRNEHLAAGDGILFRPNETHDFKVREGQGCRYFTFHFEVDDMQLRHLFCIGEDGRLNREDPVSERLRCHMDVIDRIMNTYNMGESGGGVQSDSTELEMKLRLQAQILLVLSDVAEGMTRKRKEGLSRKDVTFRKVELAEAMVEFLNNRLHSGVQVQDVARQFNVSLSYCNQLFTSVYGLPPRAYLSNRKLAEIKRYLLESKLTVEQIAELMGFASPAHFSRQFKRWTGMPPQVYRKRNAGSGKQLG